jgi:hypothetical protein
LQSPPSHSGANIEAVDPANLPAVWQQLIQLVAEKGAMFQALVTPGRLVAIEDGRAIIRYAAKDDTCVKLLERNGKKDIVRDKLSEVLRQSVGVKFEIDAAGDAAAPIPVQEASPAVRQSPVGRTPMKSAPPSAPDEPAPMPAAPAVKITPQLIESLRAEPLVRALMDQMGAQIVKVE